MGREIETSADSLKQHLKELYAKREAIFDEIIQHEAALPRDVGMETPLVDREGFPRSDVDVAAIRNHRQQIIMLRNDHRALTDKLEELLTKLHAQTGGRRQTGPSAAAPADAHPAVRQVQRSAADGAATAPVAPQANLPFALVSAVGPASPAQTANLQQGDRIIKFGPVSSKDTDSFQSLAQLMRSGDTAPMEVVYMRHGVLHTTSVQPQPWPGQGLIGVGLVPIP